MNTNTRLSVVEEHSLFAVVPDNQTVNLEQFVEHTSTLKPLCETLLDYIQHLSSLLLSSENKQWGELISLGHWLRRLDRHPLLQALLVKQDSIIKPIGTVVHFTPSNVDTMFIYSWICGVITGNKNIVRIATADSVLQTRLLDIINQSFVHPEFSTIQQRNVFVRYDKDSHWTATLSEWADARVIWGGDDSVNAIRQYPTKPRSRDISFADRYSFCVFDGGMEYNKKQNAIRDLIKDATPYLQQACSSPRVILWVGERKGFSDFVETLNKAAEEYWQSTIVDKNEQLVMAQSIVAQVGGNYSVGRCATIICPDTFSPALLELHTGYLTFIVMLADQVEGMEQLISDKTQTVTYAGDIKDEVTRVVTDYAGQGVDRIVPVGQALEFDIVWDGTNVIENLLRHVTIK